MSYPSTLQVLIVEDEDSAKEAYKEVFDRIAENRSLPFPLAPPCFAFSHEEALQAIQSSKIFHVVILDLRLPRHSGVPALDDVELGLELLVRFQDRDTFPVPALLVVSGHIGLTAQASMQESLRKGFYYGCSLVKNFDLIETELIKACTHALEYCCVGIHLRSSGSERFPTLSPRDEDLLRRSVLNQHDAIGLDLEWWSARPFREDGQMASWTKVLMGRSLLGAGRGASRPKFFKLFPAGDGQSVIDSAKSLEHKLSHIKLLGTVLGKRTALAVTEKVGASNSRPTSLDEFLTMASSEQVVRIAAQIVSQVKDLGDLLEESRSLRNVMWQFHDTQSLKTEYTKNKSNEGLFDQHCDPLKLFEELVSSDARVRLKERSLTHGDLHVKNIAIDVADGQVDAYIFDPAAKRDVAGRDLALLEVSAMLHVAMDASVFRKVCSCLYASSSDVADDVESIPDLIGRNIATFILEIRRGAHLSNPSALHALMVFDFCLVQFGGLAFTSSGNLIADPRAALMLLRETARWYCAIRDGSVRPPR
jgi:CheY-like chemotaxis protein